MQNMDFFKEHHAAGRSFLVRMGFSLRKKRESVFQCDVLWLRKYKPIVPKLLNRCNQEIGKLLG